MEEAIDLIEFDLPAEQAAIIKVIGVGGGGNNAVNHMYREGIKDVSFVICNTDNQALNKSPIQKKIQLGPQTTSGLGAGNNPEIARAAAEESIEEIRSVLSNNTKMVFITAGMGGGTGTGAAPVIAKVAKDMDILTVGIVTIPFAFEGHKKILQALEGVRQMSENVDALLVINNERLRDIYPELDLSNAFAKADDVLKDAAKGIAEIITIHGHINVDFADVNTIMRNGGVAIMNTGYASGENRLRKAIDDALASPLLRNNDIRGAKKILLNFYCRQDETAIKMDEITQVNEFMETIGQDAEVIWGVCFDEELDEEVKITLIATGFGVNDISAPAAQKEKVVYTQSETPKKEEPQQDIFSDNNNQEKEPEVVPVQESPVVDKVMFNEYYGDTKVEQKKKADTFANMIQHIDDEKVVDELEKVPAYKRRASGSGPQPYKPRDLSK